VIISVAAKRGKMAVEIVTEGALVREIFEAGLAELKQRFQQLNLAVDRIDIFTADQFLDQGGRFHRSSGFPDRVWGFQVPGGEGGKEAAGMPGPTEVYRFGDLTGSGIEFWLRRSEEMTVVNGFPPIAIPGPYSPRVRSPIGARSWTGPLPAAAGNPAALPGSLERGYPDTGQMITQLTLFSLMEQLVKLQQTVERSEQLSENGRAWVC